MIKISVVVAALGLALVLVSFVPSQAGALATGGAPEAHSDSDLAYGRALFSAKGCITCHHHAAVAGSGALGEGNLDLTTYRWSDDYLRRWLQDPAAVKPGTLMPNLGLKSDEIEALIAFLSAGTKG